MLPPQGADTGSKAAIRDSCQAPVLLGPNRKFRTRYDRIVDFGPFADGFGIMRDAQTAKPQQSKTKEIRL